MGHHQVAGRRRDDAAAHHSVPGRGRRACRRDRGHRSRRGHRGRHGRGAEGPGRRRRAGVHGARPGPGQRRRQRDHEDRRQRAARRQGDRRDQRRRRRPRIRGAHRGRARPGQRGRRDPRPGAAAALPRRRVPRPDRARGRGGRPASRTPPWPPRRQESRQHRRHRQRAGGVMTAVTAQADTPGLVVQARWAISDTLTMARRNLLVWLRVPAYIVFTVIQPVMFVLLFVFVFGGAIPVPGGSYVNFLMPGIIAQTAAFATFATAIALAQELKKGVIDRLRSMPMARSAVLAGRLVADTARMLLTILIIVGVGYAVGFRFQNGAVLAVAMVVLATVFGLAFCCIAAFTGLAIGDEESVQAFGLILLFPLTFVSSAFVPIQTMRAMAMGGTIETNMLKSIACLAGIFIVFAPLAVRAYRRASKAGR